MNELALFTGAGGGLLGGKLLGWRTVCAVEYEPYPTSVLMQRQNDKVLETFPIWDDVCTFDGKPWRGIVDVVSGGFPCQDISSAGKGAGIEGERSGLWKQMLRISEEVRPEYIFIENSHLLRTRGLVTVLQDLAKIGYNAEWTVMGASDVGANHVRKRMWILARDVSNTSVLGLEKQEPQQRLYSREHKIPEIKQQTTLWKTEPNVGRVVDGVAARVDRLKAVGNGQVPLVAASAFVELYKRINN